jgi:hypothetical protein
MGFFSLFCFLFPAHIFAGSDRRPFICVLDVRGDRATCVLMRSVEEDQVVTITSLSWKNDHLLVIEGNSRNGRGFIVDTLEQKYANTRSSKDITKGWKVNGTQSIGCELCDQSRWKRTIRKRYWAMLWWSFHP